MYIGFQQNRIIHCFDRCSPVTEHPNPSDMDRRSFVAKLTAASVGGTVALKSEWLYGSVMLRPSTVASESWGVTPQHVVDRFQEVLRWMEDHGWVQLLRDVTGHEFDRTQRPEGLVNVPIAIRPEWKDEPGFDDFGGDNWITPGDPAFSLIYHALASPHVLLPPAYDRAENYPTVAQLDAVENYVYALTAHTTGKLLEEKENDDTRYVVAVMAYEYRTRLRTPHKQHADLVFSRTGMARVGQEPLNYDSRSRCYTNAPADPTKARHFAVTPTRYGAFLAKQVPLKEVSLQTKETRLSGDKDRKFLLPVRKLFDGDPLLDGGTLHFAEHHRNEKLKGLFTYLKQEHETSAGGHETDKVPFVRNSHTNEAGALTGHDSDLVRLERTGSSVLLAGLPAPLITEAMQNGKRIWFVVPKMWGNKKKSNRRYQTFKLMRKKSKDVKGAVLASIRELIPGAQVTDLREPRNAPMFANIRYRIEDKGSEPIHLNPDTPGFPDILDDEYMAAAFEDAICHGCVAVESMPAYGSFNAHRLHKIPAVSLVTAPDFFPWSDLRDLDEDLEGSGDDFFFEGGTEDISGIRLRGDSAIRLPGEPNMRAFPIKAEDPAEFASWNTLAAVVARKAPVATDSKRRSTNHGQSFLPDAASNVFYPGWDATYGGKYPILYLTTLGLGSPFAEDMKLCAAANGMWPVSSPDAARTFQGRLEKIPFAGYPVTSVPLLDHEIGYHVASPAVMDHGVAPRSGWDGECGPYIAGDGREFVVDFTDIVATDYVRNALEDRIDASILRSIPTQELIQRMNALRSATAVLGYKKVRKSKLWLVGAERVNDWTAGDLSKRGYMLPGAWTVRQDLVRPAERLRASGPGYLFLFVDRPGENEPKNRNKERLTLSRPCIYIVQTALSEVAWVKLFPKDVLGPLKRPWQ